MKLKDYIFKNPELLKVALTHPSAAKSLDTQSYERMEFLGDSILNASIVDIIYNKFPEYTEGQLSVISANLINSKTLASIARNLNIVDMIILDSGEEQTGGRKNPNNLENALEAIIGAIYLDSDFITVKTIIQKWWVIFFEDVDTLFKKDDKSLLQEIVQKKYRLLPKYKIDLVEGQSHNPTFTVSVVVDKYKFTAKGKTKKEAQKNAAKAMLNFIND